MKIINSGIGAPTGFKANGLWCGIKKSGKPDLSLLYSQKKAVTVGVFTKNSVKAAPLLVSMANLRNSMAQAVVVNSGNANCFTGQEGIDHAKQTVQEFAKCLGINPTDIVVTSTGIIGRKLPVDKIVSSAGELVKSLSKDGSGNFAKGILTTDLFIKQKAVQITLSGKKVTVAGCAKGSGMIAPNMATMLGFVTTDANIDAKMLKVALKEATDKSFNSITVDGCMSTNDMVVVMANAMAGNTKITKQGKDFETFLNALTFICVDLAKKIVLDGEGATKFITINVTGAKSQKQAKTIALTIANSSLVKTAAYGSNPNWGRVAAAVGSLGIKKVDENSMKIKFSPFDKKEITITVKLELGESSATVYTSDLSEEYVRINGRYN